MFYKSGSLGLSLEGTRLILLIFYLSLTTEFSFSSILGKCEVRYINWYQSLGYPPKLASTHKHIPKHLATNTLNHISIPLPRAFSYRATDNTSTRVPRALRYDHAFHPTHPLDSSSLARPDRAPQHDRALCSQTRNTTSPTLFQLYPQASHRNKLRRPPLRRRQNWRPRSSTSKLNLANS